VADLPLVFLPPMQWDGSPFNGAKLAAMHGDQLLVYRRDHTPGILFPGFLDLPGGGREGAESPAECALRELAEEFGLVLPIARIEYARAYAAVTADALPSHFFALRITAAEIAAVQFGDEGEYWELMAAADFVDHPEAVPNMRVRLCDFLSVDKVS
jgi:8-oxo-dGTP diphosphatase